MTEMEWVHVVIGAVASGIFIFQTFGTAGHDVEGDGGGVSDADISPDGVSDAEPGMEHHAGLSSYLSVRNFVAFFIGYGWITLASLLSGLPQIAASFLGVIAGLVFIVASLYMIRTFLKFQEDGSLKMESLVGQGASVYISIGESGSTQGKVMVDTHAGRMELPARTKDAHKLSPGKWVKIVGVESGVLWVSGEEQ